MQSYLIAFGVIAVGIVALGLLLKASTGPSGLENDPKWKALRGMWASLMIGLGVTIIVLVSGFLVKLVPALPIWLIPGREMVKNVGVSALSTAEIKNISDLEEILANLHTVYWGVITLTVGGCIGVALNLYSHLQNFREESVDLREKMLQNNDKLEKILNESNSNIIVLQDIVRVFSGKQIIAVSQEGRLPPYVIGFQPIGTLEKLWPPAEYEKQAARGPLFGQGCGDRERWDTVITVLRHDAFQDMMLSAAYINYFFEMKEIATNVERILILQEANLNTFAAMAFIRLSHMLGIKTYIWTFAEFVSLKQWICSAAFGADTDVSRQVLDVLEGHPEISFLCRPDALWEKSDQIRPGVLLRYDVRGKLRIRIDDGGSKAAVDSPYRDMKYEIVPEPYGKIEKGTKMHFVYEVLVSATKEQRRCYVENNGGDRGKGFMDQAGLEDLLREAVARPTNRWIELLSKLRKDMDEATGPSEIPTRDPTV